MRVIIAGSRDIESYEAVCRAMENFGQQVTEVVSGCARGIDKLGEQWARSRGIPVKRFPANWKQYGKAAGPIRNKEMAEYADALVAIPRPASKGTVDMIKQARARGLLVSIHEVR